MTQMLTDASQHNLTRILYNLKYLKQHIKPHPNISWGKPRFRVEPHIICFLHNFLRDSICLHFTFLRCQTEAIFKVKVKLVLKCEQLAFLSAQMQKYLPDKNVNKCFQHNCTYCCYVKQHVKTLPESTSGKASFSGKFQNGRHYASSLCILFNKSLSLVSSQTEVIFKVKVKLDLKYK